MLHINFQSILCGLVALAELIPTNIDDLEVKLSPVIFIDHGQDENISSCQKGQKTPIFDDLLGPEILTFLPRIRSTNGMCRNVADEMSITSMWSRGSIRVDTDRHR